MQHEPLKPNFRNRSRTLARRALLVLPGLALVAGCGEALNLGADETAISGEEETCSVGLENVMATTQAHIDALSGCRELAGSLTIRVPVDDPASLSFAPLASLEVVQGALTIEGPATSLVGFEALEQAGALYLRGLRVPDLTSFQSLAKLQGDTRLRVFAGGRAHGLLSIDDCEGLIDMHGLEALAVWTSLSVTGVESLERLTGLQAPLFLEEVNLLELPRLTEVNALQPVREMTAFNLIQTGVTFMQELNLDRVVYLNVVMNPALPNMHGFHALTSAEVVMIQDNDALEQANLPDLENFESIVITGNDALPEVPAYRAGWPSQTTPSPAFGPSVAGMRTSFEVGDNAALTSIVVPANNVDIARVSIFQNPNLASLDLGNLSRPAMLMIAENPVLSSVTTPALEGVDDLLIKDNPALSVAPFTGVQTFTRDVSGNLDELAP